jgi:hypothetical protein
VLCVGLAVGVLVRIDSVGLDAASVPTQAVTAAPPTAPVLVALAPSPPVPSAPVSALPVSTAHLRAARAGEPPGEDVVTLPVGQQYVWPSGVGLVVAPPTVTAPVTPGDVALVRVRTTVLNGSAEPFGADGVLGPAARFDGHDVVPIADSRFAAGAAEQVVPPGQRLTYETTFSAGTGPLTLHYRADFRYEAVEFEDPAITSPVPELPCATE